MKVLVLGSVGVSDRLFGGREHVIAWSLRKSGYVDEVYCSPGNGGTYDSFKNVSFPTYEDFAVSLRNNRNEWLVVPSLEKTFADGVVELLQKYGIRTFGPTVEQAKVETSKIYGKNVMKKLEIPTPDFRVFHETEKAKDFVVSTSDTLVIKEEGLAGGKGVTIAHTNEEKLAAVEKHIAKGAILVEEFLLSHEFSFIGFADGRNFVPLLPARDHKRLNTNDTGPNTGGMGSYCPADFVTEKIREELQRDAEKVVRETGFKGALYLGGGVRNGERLLYEFNCRFGDPETSVQLLMMKSDIYEYIDKSIEGKLDSLPPIENKEGAAVCVVMAAPGYPDKPIIAGGQIYGLEKIKQNDDLIIFHAGTEIRAGMIVTSRGRVLEISARGRSLRQASNRAYRVVERLSWNGGQYYRTDIGKLR